MTPPTEPTGLREAAQAFVKMLEGVEVTNRETLDLIAAVKADGDARRVPADLLVRGKGHRQKYDPDTSWGAYAERVANAYPALASPGPEPVAGLDERLRTFLWLNHGHGEFLYGDDGQMQCHRCLPTWDYLNSPLGEVVAAAENALTLAALSKASEPGEGA